MNNNIKLIFRRYNIGRFLIHTQYKLNRKKEKLDQKSHFYFYIAILIHLSNSYLFPYIIHKIMKYEV